MDVHEGWWLAALALGIVEMLTGTFYLLVLALGCAVAGAAALLGMPLGLQMLVAAACSVGGWALLWRRRSARSNAADENPDLLLDVGARVQIEHWDEPRRTIARYRGAVWQVELSGDCGGPGAPGPHLIRRMDGNRLVVSPAEH